MTAKYCLQCLCSVPYHYKKYLLNKNKICAFAGIIVLMLLNWRHSGFNVFCGSRIQPGDEEADGKPARYIIRASFSQESPPWCDPFACHNSKQCIIIKHGSSVSQDVFIGLGQGMTYIPEESKVVYKSKDDKKGKTFDALEWLAAMCSHVPNRGITDGPQLLRELLQQCSARQAENMQTRMN